MSIATHIDQLSALLLSNLAQKSQADYDETHRRQMSFLRSNTPNSPILGELFRQAIEKSEITHHSSRTLMTQYETLLSADLFASAEFTDLPHPISQFQFITRKDQCESIERYQLIPEDYRADIQDADNKTRSYFRQAMEIFCKPEESRNLGEIVNDLIKREPALIQTHIMVGIATLKIANDQLESVLTLTYLIMKTLPALRGLLYQTIFDKAGSSLRKSEISSEIRSCIEGFMLDATLIPFAGVLKGLFDLTLLLLNKDRRLDAVSDAESAELYILGYIQQLDSWTQVAEHYDSSINFLKTQLTLSC